MPKKVRHLYDQFHPEHYELTIAPDRETMTFKGEVTIRGRKVGRPSKRLTFHQKGLQITDASIISITKRGEQAHEVARINNHDSFHEVRLHTTGQLYAGEYVVRLAFEAKITRGMTGLYPCYYLHEGTEKMLLATQFESHHAREVFPCIDEPEAKATFDLTLRTVPGETVLANTPVKTQITDNGQLVTTFETTPRMSTYLLAFVTGELQHKSTKTASGTEVSIWATVAQPAEALNFALEIARKSIEFFEDYFSVPYPLPKADHVALPDFSSGAMENWGLITYRERVLLAYPGELSQSVMETIATVIAHETSHQWFGNLVTMKWWDDLWLNESFADLMEYQAANSMHPEWHIWETFTSLEGLQALRRDATPGVQPVKAVVSHPDEIGTLFDPSIVYAKGGRLLAMLKHYIGEETFRKGLTVYFTDHAYGNTQGKDLWEALGKTSGIDVGAFMEPWLNQSGFPVVSVRQNGKQLTLEQTHFLDNPAKADTNRVWPVPLFANRDDVPTVLEQRSKSATLADESFVLINRHYNGHYIVNYTEQDHRHFLTEQVAAGKLSANERLMLLNDNSMLARAGYQPYGNVLELLNAYRNENNEPVWDMMSLVIGETKRFIDLDERLEAAVKKLVENIILREYKRLGWNEKPGEPSGDRKLRATVIALGSYAEQADIVQQARKMFERYRNSGSPLPPELRSVVFGVPAKEGSKEAFTFLLDLHDRTNNSDLKGDIAAALTLTHSNEEATMLLNRIKDPKVVKPQDADRWLIYLLRNRYVRDIAWTWMIDNWQWIETTYADDKSYDDLPRYAASICNTREWAENYRRFFEPKLDQVALKRNIVIGLEEIESRVAWLERDLASVRQFLLS